MRNPDEFEDSAKNVANLRQQIKDLEQQLENIPTMTPALVIDPVKSFGERSLLKDLPRAGTTQCLTECYFAIVSKESYIKLLRKVEIEINLQMMRFLRQIPYIKGWINREVS